MHREQAREAIELALPTMEFTYPHRSDDNDKSAEKKTAVTWRAPKMAYVFVRSIVSRGYRLGDVITDAVLTWKDLLTELDSIWVYVLLEAKRRSLPRGMTIAKLVREAIETKYPEAKDKPTSAEPQEKRK